MAGKAVLTVQSTKNWDWTTAYNIQLSLEAHEEYFPEVSHGEYLKIESEHDGVTLAMFGKVDIRETNHLASEEVGIGLNLRYALGAPVGESVRVSNESPPSHRTQQINEVLGKRPVLCRVRKGVHPDIGFNVCRLSKTSMDALGIAPGDRVVIRSAENSVKLKALPLRGEINGRKRQQTEQNPDQYPDPVEVLDLEDIAETSIDIPEIYLDAERREDLNLGTQAGVDDNPPLDTGVCQPVKVTRNATSVYARSLNEVTVPVIVGFLATIFVFDPWLTSRGKVAIVGIGVMFILLSILYRVRRQTFG
ncbi:hypothetical protein ACM16X_21035 [Haloarcula japonica]|uniref:hypothetical protein n=1 Tax=Haloarcula japonica TaxID=29282 RepID=UPI0039F72EDD